jgi:hypothetical protein
VYQNPGVTGRLAPGRFLENFPNGCKRNGLHALGDLHGWISISMNDQIEK